MRKILIIGPSTERTKGGIATVINGQLSGDAHTYGFTFDRLVSHVEGDIIERLTIMCLACLKLLFKRSLAIGHIHVATHGSFYRKSIFALVCKFKGVPVIMHIHGADFDSFYSTSNVFSKKFIRFILRGCSKVIVLSDYWYRFVCQNISSENVELLYNGVDVNKFSIARTSKPTLNKFLFLGRLGHRKGTYDLLKAIDILVNRKKHNNLVVYLGGDGDIDDVQLFIEKNRLSNNALVLGWLDDEQKMSYLAEVSTVVLPSYNEGLPMALIEAMASGKVVVSSKVGGIPELIVHGKNGFLITPGDIEELVGCMELILSDSAQMQAMSSLNVSDAETKYDLIRLNEKLFRIYDSTLS